MTPIQKQRRSDIISAYRHLGSIPKVAKEFGISNQRVHKIISEHEKSTGDTIPRTGFENLRRRTEWRCADCGKTRITIISRAKASRRCRECWIKGSYKHLTNDLIQWVIDSILSGNNWHALSWEIGYINGAGSLRQSIYRHLIRHGDLETINRLWPNGVPMYVRNSCIPHKKLEQHI